METQREPVQLVRGTCVSRLQRGQYKRSPNAAQHKPVGFYFSCPHCGQVRTVTTHYIREGGSIVEEDNGKLVTLTPPLKCIRCGRSFAIEDGAYV